MGIGNKTRLQLIDELEAARKEIKSLQAQARKNEQIEKELTHSRHFYQTLFENSGTATIVIEQDTTISMMNNDFTNFTGYTREEIVGHTWTMYVAEDDTDRLLSFHRMPARGAARQRPGITNSRSVTRTAIISIFS